MERMRKVQEEAGAILRKDQEEMKQQADKGKREVEMQKKENRIMLSTKDLVFKYSNLRTLVLVNEKNLVQGYTRELNRELGTRWSTLYTAT